MRKGLLSLWIAWRYLRAPKSHSAVSAISAVSVTGVAVATAAIVCVLSVFNGFQTILSEKFDIMAPDLLITPAEGKVFADGDSVMSLLKDIEGIDKIMPAVVDNALAIVDGREMPITLRGIEKRIYSEITAIDSILAGDAGIGEMSVDEVVASVGVASQLGIRTPGEGMLIFAPRREGRVNLSNPMSSFVADSVRVSDVFQAQQSEYDENNVICDIEVARNLFQYENEVSQFEIALKDGEELEKIAGEVRRKLGPGAIVKDRLQQQEVNFRMVIIEKWVTYLLLSFILVIAFFNIISTLCMLVIEKERSMEILSFLGMTKERNGSVFGWESMIVSMGGGIIGILIGVILCLLQEKFGLIRLGGDPSSMVIDAYPVVLKWTDVMVSILPVFVIGGMTAMITSSFARSR